MPGFETTGPTCGGGVNLDANPETENSLPTENISQLQLATSKRVFRFHPFALAGRFHYGARAEQPLPIQEPLMQPSTLMMHFRSLAALDEQHDDLLRRLDELDQRIQRVLEEHQPGRLSAARGECAVPHTRASQRDWPDEPLTGVGPGVPTC